MDPASIIAAAAAAHRAWQDADAKVAAAAKEQGISKEAAWAGVQAEVQRRTGEVIGGLTDPLGWRAAAQVFEEANRDNAT